MKKSYIGEMLENRKEFLKQLQEKDHDAWLREILKSLSVNVEKIGLIPNAVSRLVDKPHLSSLRTGKLDLTKPTPKTDLTKSALDVASKTLDEIKALKAESSFSDFKQHGQLSEVIKQLTSLNKNILEMPSTGGFTLPDLTSRRSSRTGSRGSRSRTPSARTSMPPTPGTRTSMPRTPGIRGRLPGIGAASALIAGGTLVANSLSTGELPTAQEAAGLAGSLGGASAGGALGAALGTLLLPGIGTVVGEVLGNIAGGYIGEALADTVISDTGESKPLVAESKPLVAESKHLDTTRLTMQLKGLEASNSELAKGLADNEEGVGKFAKSVATTGSSFASSLFSFGSTLAGQFGSFLSGLPSLLGNLMPSFGGGSSESTTEGGEFGGGGASGTWEGGAEPGTMPSKGRSSKELDPGWAHLAAFISKGEGAYDATNAGTLGANGPVLGSTSHNSSLLGMTVREVMAQQSLHKQMAHKGVYGKGLGAVGRYQIIPDTFPIALHGSGVSLDAKFNAETQDRLFKNLVRNKQKKLDSYIGGRSDSLDAAQENSAVEWASIPGVNGHGKYDGKGNHTGHSVAETRKVLQEARAMHLAFVNSGGKIAPAPVSTPQTTPTSPVKPSTSDRVIPGGVTSGEISPASPIKNVMVSEGMQDPALPIKLGGKKNKGRITKHRGLKSPIVLASSIITPTTPGVQSVGTMSPVVGTMSPVTPTTPVVGTMSPVTPTTPVVGTMSPVTPTTPVVGTMSPVTPTTPVVGTMSPVVGTMSPVVGTMSPVTPTTPVVGTMTINAQNVSVNSATPGSTMEPERTVEPTGAIGIPNTIPGLPTFSQYSGREGESSALGTQKVLGSLLGSGDMVSKAFGVISALRSLPSPHAEEYVPYAENPAPSPQDSVVAKLPAPEVKGWDYRKLNAQPLPQSPVARYAEYSPFVDTTNSKYVAQASAMSTPMADKTLPPEAKYVTITNQSPIQQVVGGNTTVLTQPTPVEPIHIGEVPMRIDDFGLALLNIGHI